MFLGTETIHPSSLKFGRARVTVRPARSGYLSFLPGSVEGVAGEER